MELAYYTAADPLTTSTPRDPDDITRLLAGIGRLCPGLKALKVTAMRRAVAVDPAQMPLQHLALACRELTLAGATETPGHAVGRGCRSIPASLHFLFVTAPHETVIPRVTPRHPAQALGLTFLDMKGGMNRSIPCIQQKLPGACT